MANIFVPVTSVDQWKQLLADPDRHWRTGYSARTLAHCWQEANGFPDSVRTVFREWGTEPFNNLEALLVLPEHQVPLPGGSRPSQSDVWVLARGGTELVSIAVEGKVSEPFGPTLEEWLKDASPGKEERLDFICHQLSINPSPPGSIRYQLLHRAASAVVEARRFNAAHAMMLVHSFSPSDEWFDDYDQFLALFGTSGAPNTITSVGKRSGLFLYFAWVRGEEHYLRM